jgi:hypothetical protein
MAQQRSFNAELLHRPGMPNRRPQRPRPGMMARARELLRSFPLRRKIMAAMGAGAVIAALIWILTPFAGGHALSDLLKEQGYWEIAAPADFYLPGTIHTIELRSDGKIGLHPTCTMKGDELARMTVASRTVDRTWEQQLDKKFDVSGRMQAVLSGGMTASKIAKVNLSFRNSSILQLTDEDLWRIQHDVVKDTCQEAIAWNLKSGGKVCQTRSALRGDLVYDISYRAGISADEKGKLTGDVAAALKLNVDQGRSDRMLGAGLIYGVSLSPRGLLLNIPDAKSTDCRIERT